MTSFQPVFNRFIRALKERSIQMAVLSPIQMSSDGQLYDSNMLFFRKIIETYERSGGTVIDFFQVIPEIKLSFFERVMISLGIFSVMFLVLTRVHRIVEERQFFLLFLGLAVGFIASITMFASFIPILGIIISVVGPIFGMIYLFPNERAHPGRFIVKALHLLRYIFLMFLVVFATSLFCIALYIDPQYLQQLTPFYGVKLSLILPVFLIGVYYFCGPRRVNSIYYIVMRMVRFPVTISMFICVVGIGVILALYIIRSGNYVTISGLELMIRQFLEDVFFIRPRFKEILIGYPALILGYWFVDIKIKRGYIWVFNALGIIALTSVINSFCHFHTPVLISVYRSLNGVFLGLICSIIFYYLFVLLHRLIQSFSRISE